MNQWKPYFLRKQEKLKKILEQKGLDAAIFAKPENTFYFSNFNPILYSHPAFVIISRSRETALLVHCIRASHAKEEGAVENIQLYGKWGDNVSLSMDPVEAVRRIVGEKGLSIGLENDYLSVSLYRRIMEELAPKRVENLSPDVNQMKIVKDDYEISCIRKSAVLVDYGIQTAVECLKNGASEAEACTQGQYQMRQLWQRDYPGSEVSGFGTSEGGNIDALQMWSMSNGRIAYGCDCPRGYYPKPGDLVLPMAWAKINGYYAENERTVAVGGSYRPGSNPSI